MPGWEESGKSGRTSDLGSRGEHRLAAYASGGCRVGGNPAGYAPRSISRLAPITTSWADQDLTAQQGYLLTQSCLFSGSLVL